MRPESDYFSLPLDSLRALGGWAADCAGHLLPVFEKSVPSDPRPRAAIEAIRAFAAGGRRTAQLRTLAMAALAAAREADNAAAASAARAAGFAASSAYTHPLADVSQTKHILGPAAYAALALELDAGGDQSISEAELHRAIESVPAKVQEILLHVPTRQPGKTRLDRLPYMLDDGIRSRIFPKNG